MGVEGMGHATFDVHGIQIADMNMCRSADGNSATRTELSMTGGVGVLVVV